MANAVATALSFLVCLAAASASQSLSQAGLGASGKEREQALESAWSQQLDVAPVSPETKVVEYSTPLKRVIGLLEKMRSELQAEADKEAEMYDKMVCWCETNEKEKTKAIADAEALDKELSSEIEARAAQFGEQATEIERLKVQISTDTASLKQATGIREAEAAKFYESNKDLIQSITNVKNAIQILGKHHKAGASLVQLDAPLLSSLHIVLKDLALKQQMRVAEEAEQRRKPRGGASFLSMETGGADSGVASLLNLFELGEKNQFESVPLKFAEHFLERAATARSAGDPAFLQAGVAPSGGSYSPQSGQIFGLLNTMKEEFEKDLSVEQKEEEQAKSDFEAMAKAKKEQIDIAKEKLDSFEGANADNQKALSDAKENLELTRDQRSKDVEFLRNLKNTCQDLDKQWALRSKTRSEETQAVAEALKIITSDDSMDLLRNTVTLLQVSAQAETEMRVRRSRAVSSLQKAARSPAFEADDLLAAWHGRSSTGSVRLGAAGGPRMRLSTLAVSVGLDSFTQIKKAMDQMVADLKKEQEEEVKFKTYCNKELDANAKETFQKTDTKEDLVATIEKLTKLMKRLASEIANAKAEIADTELAITKASQVREGENAEFQVTVADQRATQDILTKALLRLQDFYKKAKGGALLQKAAQTPPVKFNSYKTNAGASPVIGMIEQIIQDSKALESEAVAGETEAQASYEKFVKDSNGVIEALTASVAEKNAASAKAKENLTQAKSDLDSTVGELESLALTEQNLHQECDFVLANFEKRQKARMDEMEAIGQAKAILSGEK